MTSPVFQQKIRNRKRSFFLAYVPAFILNLAQFYFLITLMLMPFFYIYALAGSIPEGLAATLPEAIYGSPPRVLSLKSFACMGGMISVLLLIHAWRKSSALRRGGED